MILRLRQAALLIFLVVPLSAFGGPLEDGRAAFDRKDYQTALRLLEPLAEQGIAEAQLDVGMMYQSAPFVVHDNKKAEHWYRAAANQGVTNAQYSLGHMYATGDGVPQDYAEAAKWLLKAADQGDPMSQLGIALMYDHGDGVPQNFEEAYFWVNLAATNQVPTASAYRDSLIQKLTPDQLTSAQRRAKDWKPGLAQPSPENKP